MSFMKKYLEEHIDEYTDEELESMGYKKENVKELKDSFSNKNKSKNDRKEKK